MVCQRYGMMPSVRIGFDKEFSDNICFDVDTTVAQFGLWVESRMQAEEKSNGKWKKKYPTMAEVLGISEDEEFGGLDRQELKETSGDFKTAFIEAAKRGEVLDIDEWLKQQDAADDE